MVLARIDLERSGRYGGRGRRHPQEVPLEARTERRALEAGMHASFLRIRHGRQLQGRHGSLGLVAARPAGGKAAPKEGAGDRHAYRPRRQQVLEGVAWDGHRCRPRRRTCRGTGGIGEARCRAIAVGPPRAAAAVAILLPDKARPRAVAVGLPPAGACACAPAQQHPVRIAVRLRLGRRRGGVALHAIPAIVARALALDANAVAPAAVDADTLAARAPCEAHGADADTHVAPAARRVALVEASHLHGAVRAGPATFTLAQPRLTDAVPSTPIVTSVDATGLRHLCCRRGPSCRCRQSVFEKVIAVLASPAAVALAPAVVADAMVMADRVRALAPIHNLCDAVVGLLGRACQRRRRREGLPIHRLGGAGERGRAAERHGGVEREVQDGDVRLRCAGRTVHGPGHRAPDVRRAHPGRPGEGLRGLGAVFRWSLCLRNVEAQNWKALTAKHRVGFILKSSSRRQSQASLRSTRALSKAWPKQKGHSS
mmetsp:Transcript_45432/g.145799  ORF Transcript_45432/g.145799 Transcript_45432/m.145799 type:complete len:484 (+) Transcript_45432:2619-4070(+)